MLLSDTLPYLLLSAGVMVVTAMLTESIDNIYLLLPARITVAAALYITALLVCRSAELRELATFIINRKTQSDDRQ